MTPLRCLYRLLLPAACVLLLLGCANPSYVEGPASTLEKMYLLDRGLGLL